MKAQLLEHHGAGLVTAELPDPAVGPTDVLVDVEFCGVCHHDLLTRAGTVRHPLPRVLGHEIAGVVVAVGDRVRDVVVGDRVATVQRYSSCGTCRLCRTGRETLCARRRFLGQQVHGGFAERVLVDASCVARVPDGVASRDAAVAACVIGTSINALRDVGGLRLGESVLVTGATGGVGLHAVQLAVAMGGRVLAAVRDPARGRVLERFGAELVPIVDGRFADTVRTATDGTGVDLVVDNVGAAVFDEVRRSTAAGGRIVLVGELAADPVSFNLAQLLLRGQSLLGAVSTTRPQLEDALRLLAAGRVEAVVADVLPLDAADRALDLLAGGRVTGRLVLGVGGAA